MNNKFRRWLHAESAQWVAEGIVREDQAEVIRAKYPLDGMGEESRNTIINMLFVFGAVLVACGIIAFIAAHWDGMAAFVKLSLIMGIMLAVHWAGFYLWKIRGASPRLGHALLLLGTLIFGANIGLVAQIFHLHSQYYNGFLIWTAGALIMGYAVSSVPHAALAVVSSFIWFTGWQADYPGIWPIYSFLALPAFLPFAYRHGSERLHFLTLLAWGVAIPSFLAVSREGGSVLTWVALMPFLAALYWAYGDIIADKYRAFAHGSEILASLGLSMICYMVSFRGIIERFLIERQDFGMWDLVFTIVFAVGALSMSFIALGRKKSAGGKYVPYFVLAAVTIACYILVSLRMLDTSNSPAAIITGIILGNLAAVLWGGFLAWKGAMETERSYFWIGLLLLVLVVAGRFFEYETGLLWKSAAFIMTGLTLMAGGIWFEKRRKKVMAGA